MNGYSATVKGWSDKKLLAEYDRLKVDARYSHPAQDIFYLYQAVLEEVDNRGLLSKGKDKKGKI